MTMSAHTLLDESSMLLLVMIILLYVDDVHMKTVSGLLSTNGAKETMGQYIAGFYFHGNYSAAHAKYHGHTQ